MFDWDNDLGDAKATDAAFAKAAHVITLDLVNNRVVVNSMEPRNAVADFDAASGRSTLYTATQGPHFVRDPLAETVLKIPKEMLRLITPNVGGAFGMKAFVYPEQALVVWASRKLARPVKWQEDRSEGFVSDNQGRDHATRAELALDESGRFLGLRVSILANLGAYLSPFGCFIPTRSTDLVSGLYSIGAIHVNVKGVCTNTVPVCAYRGAGRPEAAYLLERLVDAAARELRHEPGRHPPRQFRAAVGDALHVGDQARVRFRRVREGDGPLHGGGGVVVVPGAARSQRAQWQAARHRHGDLYRALRRRLSRDRVDRIQGDDRIELVMGNQEYGTGLVTAYKQLVSDQLGVDADRIDVIMGDTDRTPAGLTGGSRAIAVGGAALYEAGRTIIEKGTQLAAHLLEVVGAGRRLQRWGVRRARHRSARRSFRRSRRRRAIPRNCPRAWNPVSTPRITACRRRRPFPTAATSSRSRSIPTPAVVSIERYTIVDDFGRTINPLLLEGQVHGGIVQGIGQALLEHAVYDPDSGQLLAGSFMDYAMPRAADVPCFAFSTHNVPSTSNPFGVKGAGEAGAVGAPPAVINAIVDALYRRVGLRHIDMPATPRRVWEMLNGRHAEALAS